MTDHLTHLSNGAAYRWLAQFFLSPPILARYREPQGRAFLALCKTVPELAPCVKLLEDMTAPQRNIEEAQAQLTQAHTRAFAIGGPLSAPPYASVYLSERGLLFQEPTREMNRLLGELDLSMPETLTEPADHLGIQLLVAAELHDRELSGRPGPVRAADFLKNHLLNWLPQFIINCNALQQAPLIVPFVRAVQALAHTGAGLPDDVKNAAAETDIRLTSHI